MNKYCEICMENVRFDMICERCHKTMCLSCFGRVDKCPYCRKVFGEPSECKWSNMIGQLNLSMKRLYDFGLVR